MNHAVYSKEELKIVRKHLEARTNEFNGRSFKEKHEIFASLLAKQPRLIPFAELSIREPELFKKLEEDEHVAKFSFARFMPVLEKEIEAGRADTARLEFFREEGEMWKHVYDYLSRVYLKAKIILPDRVIVVKPTEYFYGDEQYASGYASRTGVGATQFPSIRNWLSESAFEDSQLFHNVLPTMGKEDAERLGCRLGRIFSMLHKNRILFNDATLRDEGGANVFFQDGEARLFDFGWSIHAKDYPHLTRRQIPHFLRGMCDAQTKKNFNLDINDPDSWRYCKRDSKSIIRFLRRTPIEKFLENDLLLVETGVAQFEEKHREIGEIIVERLRQTYGKEMQ